MSTLQNPVSIYGERALICSRTPRTTLDMSAGDFSGLPSDFTDTVGSSGNDADAQADSAVPREPNNYVELSIRAMEVAPTPPIVVYWAGSETVSVEDYCAYMGELVGVEPIFVYTPDAHTPWWQDVTHVHDVLGTTKVPWRDGFRQMIAARHPEILLPEPHSVQS